MDESLEGNEYRMLVPRSKEQTLELMRKFAQDGEV
jgi:hypothetical protein